MHQISLLLFTISIPLQILAQTTSQPDVWSRFRFFEGKWAGSGTGQPGKSTVSREYNFVLNGKFLFAKNKSTWAPTEKYPKGEVHEDWGYFSRDRIRKLYVLRQFHVEGFVNQYSLDTTRTDSTTMVFASEAIENIPSGWRARETYRFVSENEFTETFELAGPGKDFEVYSETRLKRVKEQLE